MAKILYANIYLLYRTGTEVVTVETALGLRRRGHDVAVFVWQSGATAAPLLAAGIPVVTSLSDLRWMPEIVHANHLPQSILAAAALPDIPQVFCCHDSDNWHSTPAQLSLVRHLIGVDDLCLDRLRSSALRPNPPITWLPNAVDLDRFRPRDPLPIRPRRALALTKQAEHLDELRRACSEAGMSLDVIGPGGGVVVDDLPDRLQEFDVVFATARMALEAMAVGCAVIVADARGCAGLVTSDNLAGWRRDNFGKRLLKRPTIAAVLQTEIAKYDPDDARRVSQTIRAIAGLDDSLRHLESIHADAIADFNAAPINPRQTLTELADVAAFENMHRRLQETAVLRAKVRKIERQLERQLTNKRQLRRQLADEQSQQNSRSALFRQWWQLVINGKQRKPQCLSG